MLRSVDRNHFKTVPIIVLNIFGLGIVLSQFYIFASGTPQPAHYIIAIAVFVFFIRRGQIIVPKKVRFIIKLMSIFVVYGLLVDFVYFAVYHDVGFLKESIYIIYGFAIFLFIINISVETPDSLRSVSTSCFIGLLMLFALPMLHLGRYDFAPRYNAFFNDPNQMAFWILCLAAICIEYYRKTDKLIHVAVVFIVSAILVLFTASRSGLVGLGVLALGFLLDYLASLTREFGIKRVVAIVMGVCIVCYGSYRFVNMDPNVVSFVIDRVEIVDVDQQARIRGYTRIFEFPRYIILGAGHGMEERFDPEGNEIHSTWAGLLFYYGLPGLLSFLAALFYIGRRLKLSGVLIYCAPLFYSFSTFGLRTPGFWIFLGFFCAEVLVEQNKSKGDTKARSRDVLRPLPGSLPGAADHRTAGCGRPSADSGASL